MKYAKTMNCKMCMVERKEILQRMKTNKHKLINDNSDIFARYSTTLMTRLTHKKVTSTRHSKLPRVRQIFTSWILITCQPAALNYAPLVTQRRQLRCPLRMLWCFYSTMCLRTPSKKPYCYHNAQT
jgi:hypothetical protein